MTNPTQSLWSTPNRRIAAIALLVLAVDQITKAIVLRFLPIVWDEKTVLEGFFKVVHWQNTGAAWSSFTGKNGLLALIAFVALIILYFSRHHFNSHTLLGQFAFGLVIGGIVGNLVDRIFRQHVVVKDRNRDTAWFSMLDSEWPARRAAFEAWLDPSNFDVNGKQLKGLNPS